MAHHSLVGIARVSAGGVRGAGLGGWALFGILVIALFLRTWRLDESPPAINQDEAVHAYDAWSLLKTGRDHDGAAWPIFFRAFGDYHPGPFVYLLIPFEAVFGLSVTTARLPGALAGVVAVALIYYLLRRRYGDPIALTAAAFLAVSPWHMHLNRLAIEAGTCPTLVLGGLTLLSAAGPFADEDGPNRGRWRQLALLLASGAALGLATWTYHAMRVFVPLLLVGLILIYRGGIAAMARSSAGRFRLLVWGGGYLAGLLPFLVTWAVAPEQVWARASAVTALSGEGGMYEKIAGVVERYLSHFSPEFLFRNGDVYAVQSVPGHGQLYTCYLLLVPMGIWTVVRRKGADRFGLLMLWWLLAGPVPAAPAEWPGGHSLRSVVMIPMFDAFAALGACRSAAWLWGRAAGWGAAFALATAVTMTASASSFAGRFFNEYPKIAASSFDAECRELYAEISARRDNYDEVVVSTVNAPQMGTLYLFWTRMAPAEYLAGEREIAPIGTVEHIVRIGKVHFRPSVVVRPARAGETGQRILVAERPGLPVTGRELRRIFYPDGTAAMSLYEATGAVTDVAALGSYGVTPARE